MRKRDRKTLINGYSQASYDNFLSKVTLYDNNCDLIDHIGHGIQQNDTQYNGTLLPFAQLFPVDWAGYGQVLSLSLSDVSD